MIDAVTIIGDPKGTLEAAKKISFNSAIPQLYTFNTHNFAHINREGKVVELVVSSTRGYIHTYTDINHWLISCSLKKSTRLLLNFRFG